LAQSGVSINETGNQPEISAMLDVQSTSKGVLVPRLTSTQRSAINSPANGLLVYDISTSSFWFYSSGWTELVHRSNEAWERDQDTISANEPLVGIGTTNPNRMLTLRFNNANINTSHMLIEQAGSGDAWFNIGLTGSKHYALGIDNSDADKFKIGFNTTIPGSLHINTRLTIDTLGNIGIGTTAPANRLQVNSITGQNPFRADVEGVSRFQVHSNGGTSVGSASTPPVNGLLVIGAINPTGGITSEGNIVITSNAGYISVNAGGSEIRIYSTGQIDIDAGAGLNISSASDININAVGNLTLTGSSVSVDATSDLNLASGTITDIQSGSSMNLNSTTNLLIDADGALDIFSGNTMDIQNNGGTMNVKNMAGNLNVSSVATLNLDGSVIDLNNGSAGAARMGDAVAGGVILNGSTTVKIGN